jgi:hypothetical protein
MVLWGYLDRAKYTGLESLLMKSIILRLSVWFMVGILLVNFTLYEDVFADNMTGEDEQVLMASSSSVMIDNNSIWADSDGEEIKAQGGGIFLEDDIFHWIGPEFESGNYNFHAINHYTSTDLKTWTKQSPLLTPSTQGLSSIPIYFTTWVGRPWVMKHADNDYVMWLELGKLSGGNYRNRIAVFHASSLEGPWTFGQAYESLPDSEGVEYGIGDLGAFHDTSTGNAYLLYTFDKNETNGYQAIVKLSSDFRRILTPSEGGVVAEFEKSGGYCKEAAAIFKRGSTYYYIMSETRGWRPSNTWYRTASFIGPASSWSELKQVQLDPTVDAYSFRTQHDFVLPVSGTDTTTYIYCGDRWSLYTSTNYDNAVGRQAWFPLVFSADGVPTITAPNFTDNGGDWYLDPVSGQWSNEEIFNTSSNLISNGDFFNGYDGWAVSGNAFLTTETAEVHSSPQASNSYSPSAYTMVLSNSTARECPSGIYTATLWSRSKEIDYTTRKFEVLVNDDIVAELDLGTSTDWTEYSIDEIEVPENATVTLQVTQEAPARAWSQFDDFSLVRD